MTTKSPIDDEKARVVLESILKANKKTVEPDTLLWELALDVLVSKVSIFCWEEYFGIKTLQDFYEKQEKEYTKKEQDSINAKTFQLIKEGLE